MRTRTPCAALLLVLLAGPVCAQEPVANDARGVGFRVDRLSDPARPFHSPGSPESSPGPRPIEAYVWYPAAEACRAPMVWGEVLGWVGVEATHADRDSARARAGREEFVAWMASLDADTAAARAALEFPLRGCEGAPAAPGRYPLALLAVGRDDSPAMHAVLGEALASRGWVVLASPGLGARERPMQFDAADIEAQVADLAALAAHADTLPFVDASRPAVLGFSYGSGSAILYAMSDTTVSAVVSLDGSIGFADRVTAYTSVPGWRPDQLRAPVLHLRAPDEERRDLSALEAIAAPVRVETVTGSTHQDFTTLGPVSARGLSVPAIGLDDVDGDEIHAEILAATLEFLEDHRPSP